MQRSDIEGVKRRGRLYRAAGLVFGENPFYMADVPLNTPEQLFSWNDMCLAWASGSLDEDAGRDVALQSLLRLRWM